MGLLLPLDDGALESFVTILSLAYLLEAFSEEEFGVKSLIKFSFPFYMPLPPFLYDGDYDEVFYFLSLDEDLFLSLVCCVLSCRYEL